MSKEQMSREEQMREILVNALVTLKMTVAKLEKQIDQLDKAIGEQKK